MRSDCPGMPVSLARVEVVGGLRECVCSALLMPRVPFAHLPSFLVAVKLFVAHRREERARWRRGPSPFSLSLSLSLVRAMEKPYLRFSRSALAPHRQKRVGFLPGIPTPLNLKTITAKILQHQSNALSLLFSEPRPGKQRQGTKRSGAASD